MKHIPLTQGKFATVDNDDFEWLNRHKWYAKKGRNTYYAIRNDNRAKARGTIRMHREILGLTEDDGKKTDHRNSNGLNNCRANLRVANDAENARNRTKYAICTSKFKGVTLFKARSFPERWRARISYNKKRISLGVFATQTEAAQAYNKAAKKYFGKFAKLNLVVLNV